VVILVIHFLLGNPKKATKYAFLIFGFTAVICGCASHGGEKSVIVQVPDEKWWSEARGSQNMAEHNLAMVRFNMMKVSATPFLLGIAQSHEINAYAEKRDDKNLIIFTGGFLQQFASDPDVLAFTMGHELAHHQLGHTEPGRNQSRDIALSASSQALGMIASYFIPFSGLLVGNAVKVTGLSFNRDDERAADDLGTKWAVQAGYSACGGYRFAGRLNQLKQGTSIPFLSTHPGNDERMEGINNFQLNHGLVLCEAGAHG